MFGRDLVVDLRGDHGVRRHKLTRQHRSPLPARLQLSDEVGNRSTHLDCRRQVLGVSIERLDALLQSPDGLQFCPAASLRLPVFFQGGIDGLTREKLIGEDVKDAVLHEALRHHAAVLAHGITSVVVVAALVVTVDLPTLLPRGHHVVGSTLVTLEQPGQEER